MKIIKNEKDTSTCLLDDKNKPNETGYKILNKNIPIKYNYSNFLKTLNTEVYVYEITDSHEVSGITNPIFIDNIEIEEKEEKILDIATKRYRLFSKYVIPRLKNFSKLEKNWDSYGASKISWSTIANAIDFFMRVVDNYPNSPIPFVAPYPDGRIHFEWQKFSKELHHLIPKDNENSFIYRMIIRKEGVLEDYYDKAIGIEGMLKIFSIWNSYE